MNHFDVARWNAAKRVQEFNQSHASQLAAIPDYGEDVNELQTVLQQLDAAATIQQQDNSGETTNKSELRVALADTMVKFTKRAVVKAQRLGNRVLEQGLDHTTTYYTLGTATQCISRANAVKDLLNANLATLTNISAADIATVQAAITAFENVKEAPLLTTKSRKVNGTDQITQLLERADTLIDRMADLIDSYLGGTILAAEFDSVSKPVVLGSRSNALTLHIVDAATNTPIGNATVSNISGTKTTSSSNAGIAFLEGIRVGTGSFTVAAENYALSTVAAKVTRGTNTDIIVKLEKR